MSAGETESSWVRALCAAKGMAPASAQLWVAATTLILILDGTREGRRRTSAHTAGAAGASLGASPALSPCGRMAAEKAPAAGSPSCLGKGKRSALAPSGELCLPTVGKRENDGACEWRPPWSEVNAKSGDTKHIHKTQSGMRDRATSTLLVSLFLTTCVWIPLLSEPVSA